MVHKDLVLILGDSYVVWLERFIDSSAFPFCTGLPFEAADCRIQFAGFRGGGGGGGAALRLSVTMTLSPVEMPSIVVLCLGGNDVYGNSGNVLVVGMRLYEYAQSLVAMGVKHVVVCQIIRHQCVRRLSWDEGTQRVLEINEFLRAVSDTDRLSFWVHRGFWQSLHNIFRADGVHFNDRGNFKLWRSIKGAIFGALKQVHGER